MNYKYIKKPEHPNALKHGYIKRCRFIMSEYLDRPLLPNELVHHVNGNKSDDRLENLVLITRQAHAKLHSQVENICNRKPKNAKICPNCGKKFIHKWNHKRNKCCSIECRAQYYRGPRGTNTKITQEIANNIKKLKGIIGSRKIAIIYGISPTQIKRILRGDIW